jgi:hypothetical protein
MATELHLTTSRWFFFAHEKAAWLSRGGLSFFCWQRTVSNGERVGVVPALSGCGCNLWVAAGWV